MDIVTFETAKRLKAAGFPQPEPAFGQFWYNRSGTPCIMSHRIDPESSLIVKSLHGGAWYHMYEMKRNGGFVFAPSATDILRELKNNSGPLFWWSLSPDEAIAWRCVGLGAIDTIAFDSRHENPAEACADAWLQLQEK